MSTQPVTAISSSAKSQDSSIQSDPQVQKLEYQINDWSTCPTTPPAIKKQIVSKLQDQLDSVESGIKSHEKNVQAQKQADGTTGSTAQSAATSPPRFVSPFRVDTYA